MEMETTTVPVVPERVVGDINGDGVCNLADVVLLQKWLLAVPDTALPDWRAGDLQEDNCLNGFDLVLLRQMLLEQQ
jgi:hypothetical protein